MRCSKCKNKGYQVYAENDGRPLGICGRCGGEWVSSGKGAGQKSTARRRKPAPPKTTITEPVGRLTPQEKPFNVQVRVDFKAGWFALFGGESQGRALERVLPTLNRDGYTVAFIVEDRWSFARKALNYLVTFLTLGFVSAAPGLLIIGERWED